MPGQHGQCPRKMRFSAVSYPFCSSSCWFTRPVTYASRRGHCAHFMQENHHRRSFRIRLFEYFDQMPVRMGQPTPASHSNVPPRSLDFIAVESLDKRALFLEAVRYAQKGAVRCRNARLRRPSSAASRIIKSRLCFRGALFAVPNLGESRTHPRSQRV